MAVKIPGVPNEHKEEIMQLFRDGVTLEEIKNRFPKSLRRSIYRYQVEVANEKKGVEPAAKKASTPGAVVPPDKPAPMAAITSKSPAPIVFGMDSIYHGLDPEKMVFTYLLYESIKEIEPSIDDDFSTVLKVAVSRLRDEVIKFEADRRNIAIEVEEEAS